MEKTSPQTSERKFSYFFDRENVLSAILLTPAFLYILLLVGVPFVLAIAYAFSDATIGNPDINFVGLKTFERTVENPVFQKALFNTFRFTIISQILVIILANILALLLTQEFPGKWMVRFLILLPWATPIALGAIGWLWMLDTLFSPIDWVLRELDLLGPNTPLGPRRNMYWLAKPDLAVASVITVHVWRMLPLSTVIIMAGLTSIPQDIKDAVAVDGVGFWRDVFEVRLPLILPVTAVASLFGVIFTFTDMTVVYVLTQGGPPDNTTQVLASWAYFKGIVGTNLSEGAATAIFLFPMLLGIVILVLRLVRRLEVR